MQDILKNKPLLKCILEDLPQGTSATVLTAKQMLLDLLKENSRIDSAATVADLKVITSDSRTLCIEGLASDSEDVRRCTSDGLLTMIAYYAEHKFRGNAVLLQVGWLFIFVWKVENNY